jgi:hypothetical protein
MIVEGSLQLSRVGGARFTVAFMPYESIAPPARTRTCPDTEAVHQLLALMGVERDLRDAAVRQVFTNGSANIPNVRVTRDFLAAIGL